MSNRLTFSLASLILLIGLLAAPAFVYAETVSTVAFTSTPSADKGGNYGPGDKVQVTVTFSGAVDVVTTGGTPTIALGDDDASVGNLSYVSGSGTATLVFESAALTTNASSDTDGMGITNPIEPNGGAINDTGTANSATLTFTNVATDTTQTVDTTAPTYNHGNNPPSLDTTPPYHVGDTINVTLTFVESTDGGMATKGVIPFQIGSGANPDRYLQASASTATTVTFSYTVQSGDSGLARINAQKVPRSIMDLAGNKVSDATNLLANDTTATMDLGNVSTMQPRVSTVAITSTGPYTDTTATSGDAIDVMVTFSEAVDVTGTPQIALMIGKGKAQANYASGTGTTALVFSHSIVAADAGDVSIAADALALNGGSINAADTFKNPAVLTHAAVVTSENQTVDSMLPTVTAVAITSKADVKDKDRVYVTDDKINVQLTFSEGVTVTGKPTLALTLWSENSGWGRAAAYESGTGTDKLVFSYKVRADDSSNVSVYVDQNSLGLPSADVTIRDAVGNNAVLAHSPASQTATVNPDTTAPTVKITAPDEPDDNDDLKFTITFNEPLLTGNALGALQKTDFAIDGGAAAATDPLTGPTTASTATKQIYELLVTPATEGGLVTVSLKANSVTDPSGNIVDSTAAGATAMYDKIPPTVTGHTAAVNTDIVGNYLDITFTFSEAVKPFTVDAIDSGAQTQNVDLVIEIFGPTQVTTTADVWKITVKVVDPNLSTSVRLKVGTGAVKDIAGNTLAATYSATVSALVNSDPAFDADAAPENLPAGLCVGDSLPYMVDADGNLLDVILPLAKDSEDEKNLTYSLTKGTVSVPNAMPSSGSGFYWETTDAQARILKGTATLADGGTYTWTVMDSQGAMDSMTFSIIVKALQPPVAVTGLTAEKVDSASEQAPTQNRVKLMWTAPTDKSAYSDCIPAVTSYTVAQAKLNELTGMFVADGTYTVSSGTATSYTTPDKLPNGIYQFTITATNSVGNSPASELAVWKKTGGKRVVVADVPEWDSVKGADLRAAVDSDGNHVTVNWLKIPDTLDGDAPVYDDMVAATHADYASQKAKRDKFYGSDVMGDFAGYTVYVINQATQNITRYPTDLPGPLGDPAGTLDIHKYATTVSPYSHPTYRVGPLAPGQYVFRVTASNVAGESARSISTIYATVTIVNPLTGTPPSPPTPATSIASKGYAVFVPSNYDAAALPSGLVPHTVAAMPDLGAHFVAGGTIDVAVTGKANHNVIITEIMVAKDLGRVGQSGTMRPEAGQWIELYNNTNAAINISDITLTFTPGYPAAAAPANATDRLSNTVAPGWGFDAAFGDAALSGQTATNASGVVTVTKTFKSLRRVHKDNKKLQDAGTVIQNGWAQGSWALTADTRVFLAGRVGTPGSENRPSTFTPAVFKAPTMEITFSEIANRSDNSNEWIELKGPAGKSLKKVKISSVTAIGTETTIYQFPDNDDVKFPSNGILLITDQNPANNALAADLDKGVPKEGIRYRIRTLAPLPNDGNFLLVLRDTGGEIEDVAGHATGLSRNDPYTTLWPLAGNVGRISAKNKLEADKVYRRARGIHGYSSNKDNGDEPAFEKIGFTGIGYDRNASVSDMNGGTPGYPNDVVISAGADATKNVIISEIMYDAGKNDRLPQWIELFNMSDTKAVDLHNWRLYIVNHDDNSHFENNNSKSRVLNEIWLRGVKIPPRQTALIVSRTARQTTQLPRHRIVNAGQALTEPLLNPKGFYLRLEANSHEGDLNKRQAGDKAGNLVAFDSTRRRSDHQAFEEPAWALPNGADDNGDRFSISRKTSKKIMMLDGTAEWHWLRSDEDTRQFRMGSSTYYGHSTDMSSPGQTVGSVLPVSLSKFRPERLKATGEVVIRWITESETNNAGFNILRSETRDGEYTKLNTQLIKGQGTTSERTTYEYADKTAKPNVVYYYQIQDVSLDGDAQTLRISRLKGNVNAAGKLTTTWGGLKALQ